MKCNHCGKEFGDGLNCQYCGIDRVEGLGSLIGFDPGSGVGPKKKNGGSVEDKFILCYNCEQVIPSDSEYCPYCQKAQYVICPKCGFRYLAQYPSCYKCGTNREQYFSDQKAQEEKERMLRAEQARKEAEQRRRREEQERREAEIRRQQEIQRQLEIQHRLEARRLKTIEERDRVNAFLKSHRESLVIAINDNLKSTRREFSKIKIGLVLSIVSCFITVPVAGCFIGTDYNDFALLCFYVILPISVVLMLIFSIKEHQFNIPSPEDLLIEHIKNNYFSQRAEQIKYLKDKDLLALANNIGLVCDSDEIRLIL